MSDDEGLDFSLFGDVLVKPSTGETAEPEEILTDKLVRVMLLLLLQGVQQLWALFQKVGLLFRFLFHPCPSLFFQVLLYFSAHYSTGK
jgi:hypothetical protein